MNISKDTIFGLVIVLIVASYAKYILGWSLKDLLIAIIKEFSDLFKLKPTPGAINAATLMAVFLMGGTIVFFPKFEKILSVGGAIPATNETQTVALGIMAMLLLGGLVCVSLIKSDE